MKEKNQNNLYSNDIDAISLYEIVSVLLSKIYIIFFNIFLHYFQLFMLLVCQIFINRMPWLCPKKMKAHWVVC